MGLLNQFKALFKAKTQEPQPEPQEKSASNLSVGDSMSFDFCAVPELSNMRTTVESSFNVRMQFGKPLSFYRLSAGVFLRSHSQDKVEVMKEADVEAFLELVGDDFDGFMEIDDNEISNEGGKDVLRSDEKSFELSGEADGMIPEGTYYTVADQVDCSFDGHDCRFARLATLDKEHWITIVVMDGGDTNIYVSKLLPTHSIKSVF